MHSKNLATYTPKVRKCAIHSSAKFFTNLTCRFARHINVHQETDQETVHCVQSVVGGWSAHPLLAPERRPREYQRRQQVESLEGGEESVREVFQKDRRGSLWRQVHLDRRG